ncbi:tryptophan--tRNA ligase [Polycladomyces abyssicola]|uniref:Tryptophan--tRNA ligase n=2 Tax=Polycladomyces abyssicola TaxID=1125966 RepID=A0A8D5UHB5_9BACL|nr:tryptophan--tRNA ligase [Polycladomyces abyssicola]
MPRPYGDGVFYFGKKERESDMKRMLSGIQPTGNLHLGNYLGALKRFVELQDEAECFYCVVDLHALTVPRDPDELREKTLEVATLYLAAGLDPKKATLFVQSHVRAHTEAGWLLQCVARMGELNRMTQFKEKSQGSDGVVVGLYTYPVLQAADIVLYQADAVPVGEDQKQHLELARDLAERFNNRYGKVLTLPEPLIGKIGARIMGLDNPVKKMSKSAGSEANYIALLDEPDVIVKKIKRAVTDSENCIAYDPESKPGISNLLVIYSLITGQTIEETVQHFEGKGYGQLKKEVAEAVVEHLTPIRERYHELRQSGEVERVLAEGAEKASAIADETLARMKEAMGLVPPFGR